MSEFNNRIAAQRHILSVVNAVNWQEELFGLSSNAIDRWVSANRLKLSHDLVGLIRQVAEKLFFLSNKSQEQITEDYKMLSHEVSSLTDKIEKSIVKVRSGIAPSFIDTTKIEKSVNHVDGK